MKFKILTLNLRLVLDRWEERLPLIAREVRAEAPDVLAVQELALWQPQTEQLLAALNRGIRAVGQQYECLLARCSDREECVAFFRRRQWVGDSARLELTGGGRVVGKLALVGKGGPFEVLNTHLHHMPYGDESIRLPQAREVLAWTGERAILVGDFNTAPGTATIRAIKQRLASAHETLHGQEPDYTYPTPLAVFDATPAQGECLDYIFYTAGRLKPLEARVVCNRPYARDARLYPSDHFGLAATFEV